ncbi:MAG: phosphotransferase family protein [Actinomycetota bacterium]
MATTGLALSTAELTAPLERLCRAHTGDRSARVSGLGPVGGHAGLTLGFDLHWSPEGESSRTESLILRLAPPGVRAAGPADVVRQARLLECLRPLGVAVPRVRWSGSDPQWFGTPFSVVERLAGRTFGLDEPEGTLGMGDVHAVGQDAVARLAQLHDIDWTQTASVLDAPIDLATDIARWDRFVERAGDPKLVERVPELRAALWERIPAAPRTGIVHGDYQWSNLLVADERIAAILDWELAAAGPVLTDLGWLCLFSDPGCWAEPIALPSLPEPLELAEHYARVSGADVEDIDWYRAHAAYKFGIIGALNLGLHRRGKRHDPFWEEVAPSVPRMVERGLELLGG